MKSIEDFIYKLNFKKAFKLYISLSLALLILCLLAIAYEARDKIYMAIDFERALNTFQNNGVNDALKSQLVKLQSDSQDINNVLILDKDNNIVFKANDNLVGKNSSFQLAPLEYKMGYFKDNINQNAIYKTADEKDILINSNYIDNDMTAEQKFNEDFFYEKNLSSIDIHLLNYEVDRKTGNKIFVIRNIHPIPYAERLFEATGTILGIILLIYWIGLALWVYKDAGKKRTNASLWGILVLLTNLVGLIIYIMVRQNSTICIDCGAMQSKENAYCSNCGAKMKNLCSQCHNITGRADKYCSSCGSKL